MQISGVASLTRSPAHAKPAPSVSAVQLISADKSRTRSGCFCHAGGRPSLRWLVTVMDQYIVPLLPFCLMAGMHMHCVSPGGRLDPGAV